MTINIQLRPTVDPAQPILQARPVTGRKGFPLKVVVVSPHPVWSGSVLDKAHWTVAKEVNQ